MRVPSAEELAAIAAAYIAVTERPVPPARNLPRWALAGRVDTNLEVIRGTVGGTHRWVTVARLDCT